MKTRQRFYYYNPFLKGEERVNLIQVWDYNLGDTITFNFLYSFEKDNKVIKREELQETYYPFERKFIEDELQKLGLVNIKVNNFINLNVKNFEAMVWYSVFAMKA